jgi:hypothetical protein
VEANWVSPPSDNPNALEQSQVISEFKGYLCPVIGVVRRRRTSLGLEVTMKRKLLKFFSLLLASLLVVGYLTWNNFTSRTGNQEVIFTPANPQHFTAGNLNYTIYRAENGVSDDVIYHLHARNLDASIWNDNTYFTSLVQAYWQKSSIKPPTVVVVSYGPVWLLTPG